MKGKELSNQMYSLLDATFEGVNTTQGAKGTGKSFSYELTAVVPDSKVVQLNKKPTESTIYSFTVKIREMGHGERELQTFTFQRPKDVDRYNMEAKVIMSMFSIFTEIALLEWDELGRLLNSDLELREAAKKS